jgi:hypothetical protein
MFVGTGPGALLQLWLEGALSVSYGDRYARAREEQADKLFREIIEIADDASGDYVTTSDGKRIVDQCFHCSGVRALSETLLELAVARKLLPIHVDHISTPRDDGATSRTLFSDNRLRARLGRRSSELMVGLREPVAGQARPGADHEFCRR